MVAQRCVACGILGRAAGSMQFRVNMDVCHGRGRRWDLMMDPDGWRWTKAAPTLLPVFGPSGGGEGLVT